MDQEQAIAAAKKLPWAKWVAKDRDGVWHVYSVNPTWDGAEFVLLRDGEYKYLGKETPTKPTKVRIRK